MINNLDFWTHVLNGLNALDKEIKEVKEVCIRNYNEEVAKLEQSKVEELKEEKPKATKVGKKNEEQTA